MGCVSSKQEGGAPVTPVLDALDLGGVVRFEGSGELEIGESEEERVSVRTSTGSSRLGNLHRYIEGESVAAGWPSWLADVAGELVQGWLPLKADSFQKLDKIGQGTYSSVYRALEVETGKILAIKRVRLDNLDRESVKFMAREIVILRRLNHPNIIKLEGIITSQNSLSIYLVFEYMEHDLAGLLSCRDIHFSESQIKCYMQQLLLGLEHCHSRGIMHRDIKCANLLVNNEGILKIADFGLANFLHRRTKRPLTTRVVTLWYRPPELLLGSTNYNASVDLWSIGCVFAEMFLRKPILKGRTEVEQIHKIYKLCGSPSDDYWENSKLPYATAFRSRQLYKNSLEENFKFLPETALDLLKTFLSFEPHKRGTASTALESQYFKTKPYACEPSSLPTYPPTKEIDARFGTVGHRGRADDKRRQSKEIGSKAMVLTKNASYQEGSRLSQGTKTYDYKQVIPGISRSTRLLVDLQPDPNISSSAEDRNLKKISEKDPFSSSLSLSTLRGLARAKKQKPVSNNKKGLLSMHFESDKAVHNKHIFVFDRPKNALADESEPASDSKVFDLHRTSRQESVHQLKQLENSDPVHSFAGFPSCDLSETFLSRDAQLSKQRSEGHREQQDAVEILRRSLYQSSKVDETVKKDGRQRRDATQILNFGKGRKDTSKSILHFGN